MTTSTLISSRLEHNLSELVRISEQKGKGEVVTDKVADGKKQLSSLGGSLAALRAALTKLKSPSVKIDRFISDDRVTARSLTMGLSYGEAPESDDAAKTLETVGAFSGVSAGEVKINGKSIAIDPAVDSLNDVVDRINGSGAGVTASVDRSGDRLVIASDRARTPLALEEGDTRFFSSASLSPRTYSPKKSLATSFENPDDVIRTIKEAGKALDEIFFTQYESLDGSMVDSLREGLRNAIKDVVQKSSGQVSGTLLRTGYGLDFTIGVTATSILHFDSRVFTEKAGSEFQGLTEFLAGDDDATNPKGFAGTLLSKFENSLNGIMDSLGMAFAQGLLVDIQA